MVFIRCPQCHEDNDRGCLPREGDTFICDFCGQEMHFRRWMEVYGRVVVGDGLRKQMGLVGYLSFIGICTCLVSLVIWMVYKFFSMAVG